MTTYDIIRVALTVLLIILLLIKGRAEKIELDNERKARKDHMDKILGGRSYPTDKEN